MQTLKKVLAAVSAAIAGLFLLATPVIAGHYIFRGNAVIVHYDEAPGGHDSNVARFISDANYVGFGGIDVTPKWTITLNDVAELSTDYFMEDNCDHIPPRFRLRLGIEESGRWRPTDSYLYADLYPTEAVAGCEVNTWRNTGNLVQDIHGVWYLTDLVGNPTGSSGSFSDFRSQYGTKYVQEIVLLADRDAEGSIQVVYVDNVKVNAVMQMFDTPSFLCRDKQWQSYTGPEFQKQGECVKYFSDLTRD